MRTRFATWVVCGPLGHLAAGVTDWVVLLDDAHDLDAYGAAVRGLLEDPQRARQMGDAAQQRVRSQFLGARSLIDYLALISRLLA